jgi:uncharacterized protein
MQAFDLKDVKLTDNFWAPRIATNRNVTLAIEYEQCKKTGRMDAWKWRKGKADKPHVFWDSDVAKWLEAGAYILADNPDPKLEKQIDSYIEQLEKGQLKDGYLNSYFSLVEPESRWTNLRSQHELYCAGHLMEAAVAYYQATGKKKFLYIMCRYADHIDETFGPVKGKKRGYPGHQEIELALVKLFHATGEARYLKLAEFFLTERGRPSPHYFNKEEKDRGEKAKEIESYSNLQAHLPVNEQKEAVGHSVRACYMYAGMADVASETGNMELLKTCRRLWKNMTQKRMYITGGIGSERFHEGFTCDYDLPNDTAYAETCAAISLVFFAQRMLHLEKDGQYADTIERALYNGVLSGVSLNGKEFFYANRLAVLPEAIETGHHNYPVPRQEWFGCSCCPPNIARLLASFGSYIYSYDSNGIWVNLYTASSGKCEIGGQEIEIKQKTEYPWKEKVSITITTKKETDFSLNLRIPQWCNSPGLKVNGKAISISKIIKKGYAEIKRKWKQGDKIELLLPMSVERIEAHPNIRQDAGKIALQRGPIVYCLEEIDNGQNLDRIFIPESANFATQHKPDILGGITIIKTTALSRSLDDWKETIYRPAKPTFRKKQITAIPYYAWANRKVGEMLVWINSIQ